MTPPPHTVLTIEDPEGLATEATQLEIGVTPTSLEPWTYDGADLPVTVTVTSKIERTNATLWVEAIDSSGVSLARGVTKTRFRCESTATATVILRAACAGHTIDGSVCTRDDLEEGICLYGACIVSRCGDGFADVEMTGEVCDDGATNDDTWLLERHCNASCSDWAPHCGDGQTSSPETCDDGDTNDDGNGCDDVCQRNDDCGDGVWQELFEECDLGNDTDDCDGCRGGCLSGCTCIPDSCPRGARCNLGVCDACVSTSHCGQDCVTCGGQTPDCAGELVGCVCNATSCAEGNWCEAGRCAACDESVHCGPDCNPCSGLTPVCAGPVIGCVTSDCTGLPDFTLCDVITTPDISHDICVGGMCVSPGTGFRSMNAPGPSFEITDTGILECSDTNLLLDPCPGTPGDATCATTAFCGQDAQYGWDAQHAASERYTRTEPVPDEPIVVDNVTHLTWQGCTYGSTGNLCEGDSPSALYYADVLSACDTLVWGGYADWHVPSVFELLTLVDYSWSDLKIDETRFPATVRFNPGYWTTSQLGAGRTTVHFGSADLWAPDITDDSGWLRCVRAEPATTVLVPSRFTRDESVTGEPVVTDNVGNRMWQGCVLGFTGADCTGGGLQTFSWEEALAACESSSWANHTDWYLPDIEESFSIVDPYRTDPSIDTGVFGTMPSVELWTSTTALMGSGTSPTRYRAWVVDFELGRRGRTQNKDVTLLGARCIRRLP